MVTCIGLRLLGGNISLVDMYVLHMKSPSCTMGMFLHAANTCTHLDIFIDLLHRAEE